MIFDIKVLRRPLLRKIVPLVVILLLLYGNYLCYYSLGYQEIWRHHNHAVAIEFWTLISICQVCLVSYWVLIFIIGPGKSPKFNLFDLYSTLPSASTDQNALVSANSTGGNASDSTIQAGNIPIPTTVNKQRHQDSDVQNANIETNILNIYDSDIQDANTNVEDSNKNVQVTSDKFNVHDMTNNQLNSVNPGTESSSNASKSAHVIQKDSTNLTATVPSIPHVEPNPINGHTESQESLESQLMTAPDIFVCDQYGYPFYDSRSQSLTLSRSFFLKDLGYMVLKYDHYCVWVGHVIGQGNYLFFLKFMIWFWCFFILLFVHLIRYTPANVLRGEINHNFIFGYILCVFWLLMLSGLLFVHLRYVGDNMTTLDEITIQQARKYAKWQAKEKKDENHPPRQETGIRYVNVKHLNTRLVVLYDAKQRIFNMGFKENWINLIFNGNRNHGYNGEYSDARLVITFIIFLIPFLDIYFAFKYKDISLQDTEKTPDRQLAEYEAYSNAFNEEFIKYTQEKIENKECYLPLYIAVNDKTSIN